jgi:hypothetical protein
MTLQDKIYASVWHGVGRSTGNLLSRYLDRSVKSSLKTDIWFRTYEETIPAIDPFSYKIFQKTIKHEF